MLLIPPPEPVAESPEIVEVSRVSNPALLIPPPVAASPAVISRLVRVAVTPAFTCKTPTALPPLMRARPPFALAIASGVAVFESTRVPSVVDRAMGLGALSSTVLGAFAVRDGARFEGLSLKLTLAQPTAVRSVPVSVVSADVFT